MLGAFSYCEGCLRVRGSEDGLGYQWRDRRMALVESLLVLNSKSYDKSFVSERKKMSRTRQE